MTVELVESAERTLRSRKFATLYAEVEQFYARQMKILDAEGSEGSEGSEDAEDSASQVVHAAERWAGVFSDDALLELPSLSAPVPARTGLEDYVRAGARELRRSGNRLVHWIGKLDVQPRPDGSLHTRCSAIVYLAPGDSGSKGLYVCVMEDVLVHSQGAWRTTHRRVTRDDLA